MVMHIEPVLKFSMLQRHESLNSAATHCIRARILHTKKREIDSFVSLFLGINVIVNNQQIFCR